MIDWQRVGELRDEIGAEDFGEVVDLFLEEVSEVVARLRCAPDPSGLEAELHFLKGSALNLGFRELGSLCAAGERLARAGHVTDIDIGAVLEMSDASIAEFTVRLGQMLAA